MRFASGKISLSFCYLVVLLTLLPVQSVRADSPVRLVVVELFTSQGCSSCPPADALLGELQRSHRDVLPLSLNVDYWDYIGWKDPFGSPLHSERQRTYAQVMNARHIYTPQVVINGVAQAVGSRRGEVLSLIERSRLTDPVAVTITQNSGEAVMVRVMGEPRFSAQTAEADVVLMTYDREHETRIERGENRGVVLKNFNVVRALHRIGGWRGQTAEFAIPLSLLSGDEMAILVQESPQGAILGAAVHDLH